METSKWVSSHGIACQNNTKEPSGDLICRAKKFWPIPLSHDGQTEGYQRDYYTCVYVEMTMGYTSYTNPRIHTGKYAVSVELSERHFQKNLPRDSTKVLDNYQ